MLGFHERVLINILGHAAGALIFAIFLFLLYTGRRWSGTGGRYLSGFAASLALLWNVGSLVVLAWPGLPERVLDIVVALSFSVLSLLPAVLLHVSLGRTARSTAYLVGAGYVLSAVTIAMHFQESRGGGELLHHRALLVITIGFLSLTCVSALLKKPGGVRLLTSMCLALFAMSFVHFGKGHADEAWSSELFVHHAGIPLALFVLLQDYRFVLLDAFMRFLANALLAAVLTGLVIAASFRLVLVQRAVREPIPEALLLITVCLFLVFFAWLRNRVQGWLTGALFRRGGLADLPGRVKDYPAFSSVDQYLDWASGLIASALKTEERAVVSQSELGDPWNIYRPVLADLLQATQWNWAEAVVPVRCGPVDLRLILLGRRKGGRRYLSEDLAVLGQTALVIAERIESLRQQEMDHLVNQAELRALQAQINPHFLFNALNTLYGTIPREAAGARRMVLNLADIFRYFLQSNKTLVPLAEEIQIVRAYLEVEQVRLGDRMKLEIDVAEAALRVPVPVLSVQPIVENAIKHGVARTASPGYVRLRGELLGEQLRLVVQNSGAAVGPETAGTGVGLQNVRRRLEICYGPDASLEMTASGDRTSVEIRIPAARHARVPAR